MPFLLDIDYGEREQPYKQTYKPGRARTSRS
jgi:hypothetical protein